MSNWLIAIVGGSIATVIGGLVLFYILPSGQAPASIAPTVVPASARHLKCTMKGGTMDGRVYTFSIDAAKRTAAWGEYGGVALNVLFLNDQSINTNASRSLPERPTRTLPTHTHVSFNF